MTDQTKESDGAQDDRDLPIVLQQSLCSRCKQHRIIRSGKGSVFLLCEAGVADPRWPKYPPQPVQRCPKFVAS